MSTEAESFYGEWTARMSHAKAAAPEAAKGFASLYQSVMKAGAMSVREKELVALGVGMAVRCDACVYAHVEKALKAGATREQIMEAAGVVVMMQGGPGYTYLPKIVEAVEALQPESAPVPPPDAAT
jgi:AhpD family alkylhydroperoxidase